MLIRIQSKHGTRVVNLNRRKAIREKCLNCTAWFCPGVTECEFIECDLYHFRTGFGKQNPKQRAIAIRSYCLWCMNYQSYEISKCSAKDCPLYPYRNTLVDNSMELSTLDGKSSYRAVPAG